MAQFQAETYGAVGNGVTDGEDPMNIDIDNLVYTLGLAVQQLSAKVNELNKRIV